MPLSKSHVLRVNRHRMRGFWKRAARRCRTWRPWHWTYWSMVAILGAVAASLILLRPHAVGISTLHAVFSRSTTTAYATIISDAETRTPLGSHVDPSSQNELGATTQPDETQPQSSLPQIPMPSSPTDPPSPRTPPKACLAMIMKNEGPILPRLFESITGFVSEYCVVDTGSTDNTIDVLKSIDMPGVLVEEPFVNFAVTRNFLLDTCRQKTDCDYLVLLDADMVLKVSSEWDWAKLDNQDVYDFVQVSSVEYNNVRMIRRTADKIKVVGATHEYYDVPSEYTHKVLPMHLIYIDDVGDGKAKGDKFQRDERLLRAELEQEPDNVRTVFYLANTLKDQRKYREAIPFYERRATMGGWYAEADYSLYMLSTCYLALGDLDNGRRYGERAGVGVWYRRAEPLYFLALHLHRQEQYHLAWYYATLAASVPKPSVESVLFINYAIYDYWIDYERASLCHHVYQTTQHLHCLQTSLKFLNNMHAPEYLLARHHTDLVRIAQPLLTEDDAVRVLYQYPMPDHDQAEAIPILGADADGTMQVLHSQAANLGGDVSHLQLMAMKFDEDGTPAPVHKTMNLSHGGTAAVAFALHQIAPDRLVGLSTDSQHFLWGKLPEVTNEAFRNVELATYDLPHADNQNKPWALLHTSDGTYCITNLYPTINVGRLKFDSALQAQCEHFKSIQRVPRSFAFFAPLAHGITYRQDAWFLVTSNQGKTGSFLMSMVVLDTVQWEIKSYTYPFLLKHSNRALKVRKLGDVQIGLYGKDDGASRMNPHLAMAYMEARDDQNIWVVESIPMARLWSLMVGGA